MSHCWDERGNDGRSMDGVSEFWIAGKRRQEGLIIGARSDVAAFGVTGLFVISLHEDGRERRWGTSPTSHHHPNSLL